MKKKLLIEGMSCEHCVKAVKNALEAIPGLTAEVDLESKCAVISSEGEIADEILRSAIAEEGYEVAEII